jgi:peptide chain release factor 1
MSPGLQRKLEQLAERHEEVGRLLAEPEVLADNNRFRALSREFAQLEPVAGALSELAQAQRDLEHARALRYEP